MTYRVGSSSSSSCLGVSWEKPVKHLLMMMIAAVAAVAFALISAAFCALSSFMFTLLFPVDASVILISAVALAILSASCAYQAYKHGAKAYKYF